MPYSRLWATDTCRNIVTNIKVGSFFWWFFSFLALVQLLKQILLHLYFLLHLFNLHLQLGYPLVFSLVLLQILNSLFILSDLLLKFSNLFPLCIGINNRHSHGFFKFNIKLINSLINFFLT